mmetsp:Transcript_92632/g.215243  ORF Transcript_92632/g.215243 Transcript_92632/m.215243 type:complete len:286 (+) Transcript_92632:1-858(+)
MTSATSTTPATSAYDVDAGAGVNANVVHDGLGQKLPIHGHPRSSGSAERSMRCRLRREGRLTRHAAAFVRVDLCSFDDGVVHHHEEWRPLLHELLHLAEGVLHSAALHCSVTKLPRPHCREGFVGTHAADVQLWNGKERKLRWFGNQDVGDAGHKIGAPESCKVALEAEQSHGLPARRLRYGLQRLRAAELFGVLARGDLTPVQAKLSQAYNHCVSDVAVVSTVDEEPGTPLVKNGRHACQEVFKELPLCPSTAYGNQESPWQLRSAAPRDAGLAIRGHVQADVL